MCPSALFPPRRIERERERERERKQINALFRCHHENNTYRVAAFLWSQQVYVEHILMVSSCVRVCARVRREIVFVRCDAVPKKGLKKSLVSSYPPPTKGPKNTQKKFVKKKKKTSNDGQRGALARCDDDSARDVETVAILESRANCEW